MQDVQDCIGPGQQKDVGPKLPPNSWSGHSESKPPLLLESESESEEEDTTAAYTRMDSYRSLLNPVRVPLLWPYTQFILIYVHGPQQDQTEVYQLPYQYSQTSLKKDRTLTIPLDCWTVRIYKWKTSLVL